MGYRGKAVEQEQARELRTMGWTYGEIQAELGVSRSSVSLWVRDVEVDPRLLEGRRRDRYFAGRLAATRRPSSLHLRKLEEIERCHHEAATWLGRLSERDLFVADIALYAGEGFKTGGAVGLANTDPSLVALFLRWFRSNFEVDESRLRVRLYLHEGLDLAAATAFWSRLTAVPPAQFGTPYRAVADPSRRKAKHPMGCPAVRYSSVFHLRRVLALVDSLVQSPVPDPG